MLGPYTNPGVTQATGDATHWIFKDSGEPMQLSLILLLGGFALYGWYQARKAPEVAEDE